ncbi:hypothetical protein P175DRAFT_0481289 [Aspergillus ochraceoroseus IBT 24754]|uniref:Uncharacterized protein n=1 Tax=Aspergillus ochraceoroseus IBT 24754 TaxID=1392256 RepID=A0A2T5LV95_9EURO|nr:uncharacterized protein P175DRAFT_0481289 [Aspergillus ochraceoroseus IBT 24754]PTU20208.1 hypothetical protein P175DRAFT_0481289 [Aspergillus ochraceoroseus IBT 24754]
MGRIHDVESYGEADDEQDSPRQSWTSLLIWCAISYICMIAIFIRVCCPDLSLLKLGLLPLFVPGSSPTLFYAFSSSAGHFSKPRAIEIVALVPFHEYKRTEILNCYLQKNLASNDGFLDRVVFIPQTNDTDSLRWLAATVEETPSYSVSRSRTFPTEIVDQGENMLFVWIDGDVVFLEDHTIPTTVKTKLDHSDSIIVSANVVNQGVLESLHSHPSVALPYRPELQPSQDSVDQNSWRASTLPSWNGPKGFKVHKGFTSPFRNHRWLPSSDEDFDHTPIGMAMYTESGPGLDDWTVKAQQHYSFLHRLETGSLNRYKFPMWKQPTDPISQNFFCFMGRDGAAVESFIQRGSSNKGKSKDESEVEATDIIIDGKGLAAHYVTGPRLRSLDDTDVLSRYQAYAREMVCPRLA